MSPPLKFSSLGDRLRPGGNSGIIANMLLAILIASQILTSTLKEKFDSSCSGDYIVTEQDKVYSLLAVRESSKERLVLEEFTLSAHKAKKIKWQKWILDGAPNHSSHILYDIDLVDNQMRRVYSVSRNAYLSHEAASFIPTLIALPLETLSDGQRKKIGLAPGEGPDMRKCWNPPLVRGGKRQAGTRFDVKRAHWPKDGTLLAEKELDLYFDSSHPRFPFPNWIEITDGSNTFKIRCVDSGSDLKLPKTGFPLQPLEFLNINESDDEITFHISPSGSDKPLRLYAIELSSIPRKSIEMAFNQADASTFIVDMTVVKKSLEKDRNYIWFLTQDDHPEVATQSSCSFKVN